MAILVAAALLLSPFAAHAQAETETALAEALYRQARDLMAAGDHDAACPKFAESYRLDPATGTLLNLAACHERQGKLASAWLEFSDAVVAARRDGRPDRVKFAEEHIAALEPKLSRVTLAVPAESEAPELELTLDGTRIGRAAWGVPTPVDPGRHVISARAPGKLEWSEEVDVGAVADAKTVTIPKLLEAPAPVAPTSPAPVATPMPEPPRSELAPRDEATERPTPTSVYLAGGATAALAVAAGVTGFVYLNRKASYDDSRDPSDHDSAQTWGYVNAGLWAATACGAAATAYLYLTRPEAPRTTVTARLAPWASPTGAGVAVRGGF